MTNNKTLPLGMKMAMAGFYFQLKDKRNTEVRIVNDKEREDFDKGYIHFDFFNTGAKSLAEMYSTFKQMGEMQYNSIIHGQGMTKKKAAAELLDATHELGDLYSAKGLDQGMMALYISGIIKLTEIGAIPNDEYNGLQFMAVSK